MLKYFWDIFWKVSNERSMLGGAIRWMLKENRDNLDKFLSEKGIGLNLDYESANSKKKNSSLNYIIIFERKYYSNRHFAYAILELQGE